jgi:uncharacterized protein (TIGR00269 family)
MANCKCGKKAVFFRKYEGRHLCRRHFSESIEKKAKRTIAKAGMVKKGDRIALAVSGGKDSCVMLHLMHKVFGKRPDIRLVAVSVDEGVRGYRKESLDVARRLCRKLGVEHHTYSFRKEFGKTLDQKVRELKKLGKGELREPCTYCGVGRRYILNRAARELGATKLCSGHNLDDETQAILMNYMRGDLPRASRMGPVTDWSMAKRRGELFIPRIKPMREIPERESAIYAAVNGLEMYSKECPHISGIRFQVRDFLNDMGSMYSGIKFTVLETFDKILPCIRDTVRKEEAEIKLCGNCGEPGSDDVCKTCKLWRA